MFEILHFDDVAKLFNISTFYDFFGVLMNIIRKGYIRHNQNVLSIMLITINQFIQCLDNGHSSVPCCIGGPINYAF